MVAHCVCVCVCALKSMVVSLKCNAGKQMTETYSVCLEW